MDSSIERLIHQVCLSNAVSLRAYCKIRAKIRKFNLDNLKIFELKSILK